MNIRSEHSFLEKIPGVIPEHPYQYALDMLRSDRKECSRHTGYSPAATSWMMSSASEYHALTATISYFRQRCLDLQLGAKPYSFEEGDLEEYRGQMQKMRSDNIEFALMKRDFARTQLEEAVQFEWEYAIPYRAAVLLELEGLLPTFDQVVDQCLINPADKNDATLLAYARETADYFYRLIFEHVLEKHLGKEYLCNAVSQVKLVDFIYTQKSRFQKEFQDDLRSKASSIYDTAQTEGKLDQTSATILALYISWGMTGDLYSIDDHTLSRHTVRGPDTLSKDQIKKWFPRPERMAA